MTEALLCRIAAAQRGDEGEMERLLTENAPLIRSVARRFFGCGAEDEELLQLGSIGFFKAVRDFDTHRQTELSIYAVPRIAGEIRDHLRRAGPVKTPRALQSRALLVRRAAEELERETGESPRLSALCRATGLTAEEVTEALQAHMRPLSLEAALTEDGEGSLLDLLPDASTDDPAERLDLAEAVGTLEPPLRQVIALRYGRGMTQRQVSRVLGVTQGQVSRLERRALDRLKEKLK